MAGTQERPILIYHNVGEYPPGDMVYGVSPRAFRSHVDWLVESGRAIVPLDDALAWMRGEAAPPPAAVSLTFDGGLLDNYENVVPFLKERGVPAAFFIPTDSVGRAHGIFRGPFPCMTWAQIREVSDAGFSVGSFGRSGRTPADLGADAARREDARIARRTLEDKLGRPVRLHAYMEGFPGPDLRRWFIEEGFEAVLTQTPTFRQPDVYRVGRIQVDDGDIHILKTKVSGVYVRFKDTRTWVYLRRYKIDRVVHRVLELVEKAP